MIFTNKKASIVKKASPTKKGRRLHSTKMAKKRSQTKPPQYSLLPRGRLLAKWRRQKKNRVRAQATTQVCKKRAQTSPIFKLPPEIIVMIMCSFCEFKPAFCLAWTCRDMHDIFTANGNQIFNSIDWLHHGLILKWPKEAKQLSADLNGHDNANGPLSPRDMMSMHHAQSILESTIKPTLLPPDEQLLKKGLIMPVGPPDPGTPLFPYFKNKGLSAWQCVHQLKDELQDAAIRFSYGLLSLMVVSQEVMLARVHAMSLHQVCMLCNFISFYKPGVLRAISPKWHAKEFMGEFKLYPTLSNIKNAMAERLCNELYRVQLRHEKEGTVDPWGHKVIARKLEPDQWRAYHAYGLDGVTRDKFWTGGLEEDEFHDIIYQYWCWVQSSWMLYD